MFLCLVLQFALASASPTLLRTGLKVATQPANVAPVVSAQADGDDDDDDDYVPPPIPAPAPPATDCSALADVVVRGQDFSQVAQIACRFWPSDFGTFPVQNASFLINSLQWVFNSGGLWEQLQISMISSTDYCIRREVTREEMGIGAKSCPVTINEDLVEEEHDFEDKFKEGNWACGSGADEDSCACSRRDQVKPDKSRDTIQIKRRPAGCNMVHQGKCYGRCPYGYKRGFLKGFFRPTCTSVCADSNHPFSCGVGCASSREKCSQVVLNQVSEIVVSASRIASFFTGPGGVALHTSLVMAVKVAEFALTVLTKVVKAASSVINQLTREEIELSMLLTIYQSVKDSAVDIAKDWVKLQMMLEGTVGFFMQLVDSEFGWKKIDLSWISNVIMKNGADILKSAFNIVGAFSYERCELARDDVHFSIEDVGDARTLGPYSKDGAVNGRPRYRLITNRNNIIMEYSRSSRAWSLWVMDKTYGRGWWFGFLGFGWREMYESKVDSPVFPTTGWRRLEGKDPVPEVTSAFGAD